MATLNIPNLFINGTPAIATEVNANFNAVKTFAEGISTGANIDDGSIVYSKLAASAITAIAALGGSGDKADVVIGVQVFS
jgi:hypothetical protein